MSEKTIAIVGGGAGGMCAALAAARACEMHGLPYNIALFERNPRLGIKVLISGGGKCNITHAGTPESILNEGFLVLAERRFLKHALYTFSNSDILDLLEHHGVHWHARDNGRVFPDSGHAEDVLAAFEAELRTVQVQVRTRQRITSIVPNAAPGEKRWILSANGNQFEADVLILATGGVSYRKVGTTGDGILVAESFGHTIAPLRSALAPIYLSYTPRQDLVGVALRDAELLVSSSGKIVARRSGDVLLTHKGISGPATLDISREAALAMELAPISIQINLLSLEESALREMLIELQSSRPQQQIKTWLEEVLPNRLAPYVLSAANIPPERKWSALTRDERARLHSAVIAYDLGYVREIPIDRGEVTSGGVSLKEVDSKTMMSRIVPGLFFAGEMLDIAGEIGGYNLQAAYSTGWVAGSSAVEFLIDFPTRN